MIQKMVPFFGPIFGTEKRSQKLDRFWFRAEPFSRSTFCARLMKISAGSGPKVEDPTRACNGTIARQVLRKTAPLAIGFATLFANL